MQQNETVKTLNLYPLDYPFETLVARIDGGKLILDPDFQRKYKWDDDGWGRASKFIESCLMRIPLPSCYFAEDEEQNHLVIDGVQRLTTIKRFFDDAFALEGMTTYKELEGKKFSELGSLKAELEATTIRCIVLRKENPKMLIREIFSRLNQGAVKLSDQEIRHALYPGKLDDLLMELSENPIVSKFALPRSSKKQKNNRKNNREAEEQVLRFFAFSDDLEFLKYKSRLSDYLDDYMENNCTISDQTKKKLELKFNKAIKNCQIVFDEDVFTNPSKKGNKQGLVYYDLLMPTVGLLETENVIKYKNEIKSAYQKLCASDNFGKTLSGGLQKKSAVVQRRVAWQKLLAEAMDGK